MRSRPRRSAPPSPNMGATAERSMARSSGSSPPIVRLRQAGLEVPHDTDDLELGIASSQVASCRLQSLTAHVDGHVAIQSGQRVEEERSLHRRAWTQLDNGPRMYERLDLGRAGSEDLPLGLREVVLGQVHDPSVKVGAAAVPDPAGAHALRARGQSYAGLAPQLLQ